MRRRVGTVMASHWQRSAILIPPFAKFCKQHGWASFETELTSVLESTSAATIARNAELLRILCTLRDKNAERIGLCVRLSERAVKAAEAIEKKIG